MQKYKSTFTFAQKEKINVFVISQCYKYFYNIGRIPRIYFWRDSHGHEIDILIERAQHLIPVEIKAGKTINSDFFNGLNYWKELDKEETQTPGFIVYGGDDYFPLVKGTVVSWQLIDKMLQQK